MSSNFNCSYMAMSSLTYILFFSVKFFFQPIYTNYAQKFELKWSLGGPLSKLCVTPPFSINFRCQIENQVSDYRLLGASSFFFFVICVVANSGYSTVLTPHVYFIILISMIAGNLVEIRLPKIQSKKCLQKSNLWRYSRKCLRKFNFNEIRSPELSPFH
jgi:hypothetical protein